VAASSTFVSDLECVEAGCTMAGVERVGWELPAYQAADKIVASTEPKSHPDSPPLFPGCSWPPKDPPPFDLACKPAGASTRVAAIPERWARDAPASSGLRWSAVNEGSRHEVSVVVGTRAGARELPMLGPELAKAGVQQRTSVLREREGVVAVRASWAAKAGAAAPVDLDIAWWSASGVQVSRRALAKVERFTVPASGPIGEARVVDGGIVFQTMQGEPVQFFRTDGKKDETLALPTGIGAARIARVGSRWILADFSHDSAVLTFSNDDGKTWTTKTWRLDDCARLELVQLRGAPHLGFRTCGSRAAGYSVGLVPLDTIGDDPPAPLVIPPGPADAACDAQASTLRTLWNETPGSRMLRVRVDGVGKEGSRPAYENERVSHPTAAGTHCTSTYRVGMYDNAVVYVSAEPKGFSGVRFHEVENARDPSKSVWFMEPLSCTTTQAPR
jgi:hypothetical protein